MNISPRAQRTFAAAVTAILTAGLGACSSDASRIAGAERPSLESAAHSAIDHDPGARFSYVALGDSWPNGAHCGFCETFVGRYADKLNATDSGLVRLDDRTENGGTTTTMLNELRTSADLRRAVAGADILVVETGSTISTRPARSTRSQPARAAVQTATGVYSEWAIGGTATSKRSHALSTGFGRGDRQH